MSKPSGFFYACLCITGVGLGQIIVRFFIDPSPGATIFGTSGGLLFGYIYWFQKLRNKENN